MIQAVRTPRIWIALVAALALSATAWAINATKEASTAEEHAALAAKAANVKQVHMHLHHALNCLVGTDGVGYDAKAENPCSKLGDGAIPDDNSAEVEYKLRAAVKDAQAGLKADDLAAAQKDASRMEATLQQAIKTPGA